MKTTLRQSHACANEHRDQRCRERERAQKSPANGKTFAEAHPRTPPFQQTIYHPPIIANPACADNAHILVNFPASCEFAILVVVFLRVMVA